MELQLMQQGSVHETGWHSPCTCHCIQGPTSDPKQVGEHRVCGGMTALSKLKEYKWCPIDGEGHSCTLHRNYLLPISSNVENKDCEISVGGDGPIDSPAPVPYSDNALLADCLARNWPASVLNLPPD